MRTCAWLRLAYVLRVPIVMVRIVFLGTGNVGESQMEAKGVNPAFSAMLVSGVGSEQDGFVWDLEENCTDHTAGQRNRYTDLLTLACA